MTRTTLKDLIGGGTSDKTFAKMTGAKKKSQRGFAAKRKHAKRKTKEWLWSAARRTPESLKSSKRHK